MLPGSGRRALGKRARVAPGEDEDPVRPTRGCFDQEFGSGEIRGVGGADEGDDRSVAVWVDAGEIEQLPACPFRIYGRGKRQRLDVDTVRDDHAGVIGLGVERTNLGQVVFGARADEVSPLGGNSLDPLGFGRQPVAVDVVSEHGAFEGRLGVVGVVHERLTVDVGNGGGEVRVGADHEIGTGYPLGELGRPIRRGGRQRSDGDIVGRETHQAVDGLFCLLLLRRSRNLDLGETRRQ